MVVSTLGPEMNGKLVNSMLFVECNKPVIKNSLMIGPISTTRFIRLAQNRMEKPFSFDNSYRKSHANCTQQNSFLYPRWFSTPSALDLHKYQARPSIDHESIYTRPPVLLLTFIEQSFTGA